MWERAGPRHCSNYIMFRVRMFSVQAMTKMLQQSQTQWGQTEIGFGPHTHRMISESTRGSHKLLSFGILCMLPCNMFPVNKFSIRGCKGESDRSFFHNSTNNIRRWVMKLVRKKGVTQKLKTSS